jgi:hypothetical protein
MTNSTLTDREQAITTLLAQAFPQMHIDARRVDVHKREGGMASTLRFTLDDTYSADLETERIASASEPPEALANEVTAILKQQI